MIYHSNYPKLKKQVIQKDKILEIITEEKEKFNLYSQLCVYFKIDQDVIAVARHQAKIEVFEFILKWIQQK